MILLRNSVKAYIIHDDKLLTMKGEDYLGTYYLLPGGGMRPGENMETALRRECLEEINCPISIGPLLYIREYIGKNHEFRHLDYGLHQIEYMFRCRITNGCHPKAGSAPDREQTGVHWLPIYELSQYRIYPKSARGFFSGDQSPFSVYLGDIN
jgi:8-oxo-dGTP pyrophosphatase MutT (NUDIX family)